MCAQLYIQRAAQPDTWVMSGAPVATAIWLSRDTPINYSDGTTDTLPANTPAVLPDTTTSFDRTHDVYVPYTVQGSGVLSIIKESLLPTLTSAYAPLARVELHGIKPYQPEPYLVAGGAGTGTPTTVVVAQTNGGTGRVHDVGAGGTPPAGWQTTGFDDSAWVSSVVSTHLPSGTGGPEAALAGTDWVTYHDGNDRAAGDIWLLRQTFVAPVGPLLGASLEVGFDGYLLAFWVNGTLAYAPGLTQIGPDHRTVALPVGAFLAGTTNTLALEIENEAAISATQVNFRLSFTSGAAGGVPDPGGHEGDLLYYHSGAWTDLPIGASGQVVTSNGTDPAWAAPATSGTVTSVALSVPGIFSLSGSPITTSGTFALTLASQSQGTVFAGPAAGSAAAPTFRALQGSDLPAATAAGGRRYAHGHFT